jgi:tRNA pseudouridine55 synthase
MLAIADRGQGLGIVEGILNVNKPAGWTSHDVVAKLRGVLRGNRVGHAGTLDPAATGVLPVLVGRATRIAEYLLDWDKEYQAVLRLGQTTDTLDATGTVLREASTDGLTDELIYGAFARFQGEIDQLPPMYSAVKVDGMPLYKAARAGKTVDRALRRVTVYEIQILKINGHDVTFRMRCSKGTYVRTLCADIGEALGVGGHLLELERRRVGPLHIEQSCAIDEAVHLGRMGRIAPQLLTLDEALAHMPVLMMNQAAAERARHGVPVPFQAVRWDQRSEQCFSLDRRVVRLKDSSERLVGIGLVQGESSNADGFVAMVKVLVETAQQVTESN